MNLRYLLISLLAVVLGVVMIFLPNKQYKAELTPAELQLATIGNERFISSDELAQRIIEKDPKLLLVDVRIPEMYAGYSLPGAISIPLDSVLSPNFEMYLNQDSYDVILFSNGTVHSSQAWNLCKRRAFKNIYILKGGLNNWVETILKPSAPHTDAPSEERDLYQFRLAASQFFSGRSAAPEASSGAPVPVVKTKKKKAASGGC